MVGKDQMSTSSNGNGTDGAKAPYGPFQTFRNFLEQHANDDILPNRIDKSVTASMSGAGRSQLLIALRFFSLIEGAENAVTDGLRRLFQAADEEKVQWAESALASHYAGALELSAKGGTNQQLLEWFEETHGHHGTTAEKAVRFFMQLAQFAGTELSPHFSLPRATPARSSRRRSQRTEPSTSPAAAPVVTEPAAQWDVAIDAWLRRLPGPDDEWNPEQRLSWTVAFNAILDTIYPDSVGESRIGGAS